MNIEDIYKEIDFKKAELEPQIEDLSNKINRFTKWAWAFVIIGFVVAGFGILCYLFPCISGKLTLNELGDYLSGSVASAWSLAGLFFIYVAFIGQKQQLINQQIEILYSQAEIKATRFELEGQKEQLVEQNKTLRQQRFENTFFQLINNHNSIVDSIDLRKWSPKTNSYSISSQGRDCFEVFYKRIKSECKNDFTIKNTLDAYMLFYNQNQADLGHYFRNMYHILKLIKETDFITNKKRYSSLLRAQLSSYELVLLFYNTLGVYGVEKFKPLIEEYSFLKNLDWNLIFDSTHIDEYDKEKAF